MKIHIFALRWRDEIKRSSQLRTPLKRVVVNRKKIQAHTGFEPMTSAIPVPISGLKLQCGLAILKRFAILSAICYLSYLLCTLRWKASFHIGLIMTPIQYFLNQAKEFNYLLPSSKYKDREGEFHRQLSLPSDVKLLATSFKLKVHIYNTWTTQNTS